MTGSPQGWLGRLVLWLRDRLARNREHAHLDEDLEAYDRQVQVIAVNPDDPQHGRILHRGTTWDAESLDQPLVVGSQVRIVARDNLRWLVQPDPLAPLLASTALPRERPDHVSPAEKPDPSTPSTARAGHPPPKRDSSSER